MNDKLIFQHLPKCGGSTFRRIINRMYPSEKTFSINVVNDVELNTEKFINLPIESRDKIHLLHGHMKFGLHQYMTGNPKYIAFLRKPEERILSYYYYVLGSPRHRLYKQIVGQKMTLYDFVTSINESDVNNGQIMFISGIEDKEEFMLEKALENIENHFSFIGTIERFNESLVLLKKMYQWSMPYYRVLNKTMDKRPLKNIDKRTIEAINDLNRGDNMLYEKMDKVLSERIGKEDSIKLEQLKLWIYNQMYSNDIIRKVAREYKKRALK